MKVCCEGVLWRSVVEKSVMQRSVVEKCHREVL